MEPQLFSRGNLLFLWLGQLAVDPSMEPQLFSRGNNASAPRRATQLGAFNEAAAFQPQKSPKGASPAVWIAALQ